MDQSNVFWMATRSVVAAGVLSYGVIKATNGVGPLRLVGRCLDYMQALGFFAGELLAGAWARRHRWQECVERARWQR